MTHVITSLCLRDGSCVDVCPVECIVPGDPVSQWPMFYIDPETCIDCGACIPECPFLAIFPEEEVTVFVAKGGEVQSKPVGTPGFENTWDTKDKHGQTVHLPATRVLEPGQPVDLVPDIKPNYDFYQEGFGPGYKVLEPPEE